MRTIHNFNDNWLFTKPGAAPEAVTLPHTWNNVDGQDGGNDYFRGFCTYEKTFHRPEGEVVYLEFPGAAMTADVTVNGVKLCRHEGGYSAFRVDITEVLRDENTVVVTLDNTDNDRVYPQKADFTFYGGLYRGAKLICVPKTHFCGIPGIHVTSRIEGADAVVTVETWVMGEGEVTVEVAGKSVTAPVADGKAVAEVTIENVHLWDGIDDPYLYEATAKLSSGDEISTRFGCRSFHCDPDKGFFLNGRSYPLRGVSRHQDCKGVGNALSIEHHRADMEIVRELGANTLRLAHYQHAQEFYDLCDEMGIVVWAEIPYITAHMANGRANTLSQMEELITECYNHPSIVVWGLSNEITASTPVDEDMLENHRLLNDLCHRLDPTRLTTMANVFMLESESPILEIPDINSYNLYFGWYLGELGQNDSFFDEYHAKYPARVMGFSEYGADANPAYHNSNPEKGDYSESYQCVYHEHMIDMINARPYLWATHVWNLFDFAADGRDEGGKHGENQKGLVTFDRKVRKDPFYLYKAHWSKEPFLHLCGRRYVDRAEDKTEIKVYSNLPEITLTVDGKEVETKACNKVVTFSIPLTGEHTVTASFGDYTDTMTIRHVDAPNPEYYMGQVVPVVNWFDREEMDPTCYSINDTFGVLMANPQVQAILGPMMAAAIASRGDVAKSTSGNKNLQKMMATMSLKSMLKMAGDTIPPEQVQALNAALQKIRKQ